MAERGGVKQTLKIKPLHFVWVFWGLWVSFSPKDSLHQWHDFLLQYWLISDSWRSERIMPPTRTPVLPLQVTGHLANERKDQFPRTGWGHHPGTHLSALWTSQTYTVSCPWVPHHLCFACRICRGCKPAGLCSQTLQVTQQGFSHSLPLFLHIYSSNSCLKIKPYKTHFKVQHCFLLTSGFLSSAAFITPKASS